MSILLVVITLAALSSVSTVGIYHHHWLPFFRPWWTGHFRPSTLHHSSYLNTEVYNFNLPNCHYHNKFLCSLLRGVKESKWHELYKNARRKVAAEIVNYKKFKTAGTDKVLRRTPQDQHTRLQFAHRESLDIMKYADEAISVTAAIKKQYSRSLKKPSTLYRLSQLPLTSVQKKVLKTCPLKTIKCSRKERISRFRSANGRCNNLIQPQFGQSFSPFTRVVTPAYNDGLNEPRLNSVNGKPLPSARLVSRVFHANSEDNARDLDRRTTHMVMQFGQFIDHDHSLAPDIRNPSEEDVGIECCNGATVKNREACFPINIPAGDQAFSRTCMNFVRSVPTPHFNCQIGPREQINQLTAFIDGSQIYGSNEKGQKELRLFTGGLLKTETVSGFGRPFLPRQSASDGGCIIPENVTNVFCTLAGDERSNEHGGLTSIHTVWLREHNRIARALREKHRSWKDEFIFQKARHIVSAQLQRILFAEFLPILIGPAAIRRWGLQEQRWNKFFHGYNPSVNAQMSGSFSTAAYRFGHSLIRDFFTRKSPQLTSLPNVQLRNLFNRPQNIFVNGGPDSFMAGMATSKGQKFDRLVTKEVTEHLFEEGGDALDLVSLNIQRGRDHGIPGYLVLRQFCQLRCPRDFKHMPDISAKNAALLAKVYSDVKDIDLFTGGLAERPVTRGILGPTFACLLAEQHRRLKIGDRYFYENPFQRFHPPYIYPTRGFQTLAQLKEIRKATLAGILCSNTDIKAIQRKVFRPFGTGNHLAYCKSIHKVGVNLF